MWSTLLNANKRLNPEQTLSIVEEIQKDTAKDRGPGEKKGIPCWKITVNDGRGRVIAVQHVKVGEGEEVAWKEL